MYNNIEDVIKDGSNIFMLSELTGRLSGLFDPLSFFNILESEYELVYQNMGKPNLIVKHLSELGLTNDQFHYLLQKLLGKFILNEIIEKDENDPKVIQLKVCLNMMRDEMIKRNKDKYPDILIDETIDEQRFATKQVFRLSDKTGAKTNVIRILNALFELRLIVKKNGEYPTKSEFMIEFVNLLSEDLSKYHVNLSQAFKNQPLEVNLKVFDEMKSIIQNTHNDANK